MCSFGERLLGTLQEARFLVRLRRRHTCCPSDTTYGNAVWFHTNGQDQGSHGRRGNPDNGCAAKGTCGLDFDSQELGGGWQICFAA